MSSQNINLSNLDTRYSKLTDLSAAIAAQATTDASQYATKNKLNIGTRLRSAAAAAETNSAFNRPTIVDVPNWQPSTAYSIGNVVKNNNITYTCVFGGTSASAGGPTGSFGSIAADGTVTWGVWGWNPVGASDPGAPTYTPTQTSVGLNNTYYPVNDSACFALYGAYAAPIYTVDWNIRRFKMNSSTTAQGDAVVAFWTDAPKFALLSGLGNNYRIRIDGRIYGLDMLKQYTSGGGTIWHTFDFSNTSGRKPRLIEVDISTLDIDFFGVQVDSRSSVWKPSTSNVIRAVWISDSTMSGSSWGPVAWTVPRIAGNLLGWTDNWNASVGGTGWLNPNTVQGPYYTFRQRIPEMLTRNPDVWCIFGSINDNVNKSGFPYTAAALSAEVTAGIADIRAGGSKAPIIIGGCWNPSDDTGITQTESAIAAGVSASNDPSTFFIPIRNDPAGPWVSSTVNNTAHTTVDQRQQLLGGDSVHPNESGVHYFARRINTAIREQVLPQI